MRCAKNSQRGFSLIELAIVMGIISAVIGGIWVATNSVSHKSKVERTIKGLFFIGHELTRKFNGDLTGATNVYVTLLSVQTEIIPSDWLRAASTNYVISPLGGRFSIYTTGSRFELRFYDMTRTQCLALMSRFYQMQSGDSSIFNSQAWDNYSSVNVFAHTNKSTYCVSNNSTITLYVPLRRFN